MSEYLTVAELKKRLAARNIYFSSRARKPELFALLNSTMTGRMISPIKAARKRAPSPSVNRKRAMSLSPMKERGKLVSPMKRVSSPCRYKGTEPSPKGKGQCAHLTPVGTAMVGRDGHLWSVTQDKNGRHKWTKTSTN